MNTKQWDSDIAKSTKHETASEMLTGQTTGIQYTRLAATRDLRKALTTLRKLGETRETLKESVDVVCNIKMEEEAKKKEWELLKEKMRNAREEK